MGSVGINFGSATSGAGFDVATTVTQVLSASQAIETPWKTQLAALTAQDTAFTSLGTDLSALTTSLQSLTDFSGILSQKQGASSNTSLLQLTGASAAASAGSHTVVISQLAQNSSNYTDAVANAADTLSGSITIQVGSSGTPQTITVGSSSNTLTTLAAAINVAGVGVNASVITDGAGSRLSLVSSTNGAAGALTISGSLSDATTSSAVAFHTGLTGQDANFTVDGISLTSTSNAVSNAIPGVSFQLLASDPAKTIQVQVATDTSSITTAFNSFVTAYNKVIGDIQAQSGKNTNGAPEPLLGNSVLSDVESAITGALYSGSASGSIKNIVQLGITANTDGTLALNTSTLESALNNHFADVTGFLQNATSFGQGLNTALNNLGTLNPVGAVAQALSQNKAAEANLKQNVTTEDALLAKEKITLTAELNSANQILQSIPAQLNQINEIYSAITGYSKTTG